MEDKTQLHKGLVVAPVDSEPTTDQLVDYYLRDTDNSVGQAYNIVLRQSYSDTSELPASECDDAIALSSESDLPSFFDITSNDELIQLLEVDPNNDASEEFRSATISSYKEPTQSAEDESEDTKPYESDADITAGTHASAFDSTIDSFLRTLGPLTVYTREEEQRETRKYVNLGSQLLETLCRHDVVLDRILTQIEEIKISGKNYNKLFSVSGSDKAGRRKIANSLLPVHNLRAKLVQNEQVIEQHALTDATESMPSNLSMLLVNNRAEIAGFINSLPIRTEVIRNVAKDFIQYGQIELARVQHASEVDTRMLKQLHHQGDVPLKVLTAQVESLFNEHSAQRSVIALHNYKLVMAVIRSLKIQRVDVSDQFQDGVTGLLKSIDTFKPELGFKLSTLAWRAIAREINYHAGGQTKVAPVSSYTDRLLRDLYNAEGQLLMELGRTASVEELAEHMELNAERVIALRGIAAAIDGSFSVNQTYTDSDAEIDLPAPRESTGDLVQREDIDQIFALAKKFLDHRSFDMLDRHFRVGETQNKIARVHRVTRQRVQEILKAAVTKIRTLASQLAREGTILEPVPTEDYKTSHLFDLFYKAASLPASERPAATMQTLEHFAGDVNFWHCFIGSNDNYIKFFRARVASSKEGFDISKLSTDRQGIFHAYLDERVPDLTAVHKTTDRAFATLLRCPRTTRAIQRAMVSKGWRATVIPDGAGLSIGTNDPSPYVDERVVSRQQTLQNLDKFIAENYRSLEDFHHKGPGAKMISKILDIQLTDLEKIVAYFAREGGPLSSVMPVTLPATRARKPSFYFREEIVGRTRAYTNAGRWVRYNIGSLDMVRPHLKILRSLVRATEYGADTDSNLLNSAADVAGELIRRCWIDPQLPLTGHGIQTTKSYVCSPAVTASKAIAEWNRALILGRVLPELPKRENRYRDRYYARTERPNHHQRL